jgi:hypothetical protein
MTGMIVTCYSATAAAEEHGARPGANAPEILARASGRATSRCGGCTSTRLCLLIRLHTVPVISGLRGAARDSDAVPKITYFPRNVSYFFFPLPNVTVFFRLCMCMQRIVHDTSVA